MEKYLGKCEEEIVDMKIRTRAMTERKRINTTPYNVYKLSSRRRNFPVSSLARYQTETTTFDDVATNCSSSTTCNEVVVCNSADFPASSCCSTDISSSSSSSSTEFIKNCDPQIESDCKTSSKSVDCKKEASSEIETSKYDAEESSHNVDYPVMKPTSQIKAVAVVMMPSEAEIEDFFSSAEKDLQKRFANKYNFDIVKDVPLEGRYEWVEIKP